MMIFGILTKWHCNKNCICCKYVGLYINICYFTRVSATTGVHLYPVGRRRNSKKFEEELSPSSLAVISEFMQGTFAVRNEHTQPQ
jgi:hypothetical protein